MKKVLTFLIICLIGIVTAQAQTNSTHYAHCKVFETKHKVVIEFSDEVRFLGKEYETIVMYVGKKRLEFTDGNEAVSYLSASWGWVLCGNPIQTKKGTMWTLRHEVDNNIVNFQRNVRFLEQAERQRAKRQSTYTDDLYDQPESF